MNRSLLEKPFDPAQIKQPHAQEARALLEGIGGGGG
jgi:hypothetical protein